MRSDWEAVIGMEVHAQVATRSKMFCGCSSDYLAFPPNGDVCEVCLGMPGVLPVVNERAVELVTRAALALNCTIAEHTKFDRKNYFYPDLPKGYQISQYDLPLSVGGWLELDSGRRIRITRVHMEEDTGKLLHAGDALQHAQSSLVDLNRAGVPLMEIVTEPDLRSADEARDYAMTLRAILRAVGASEADMEKGQLRAEANVSVRRPGEGLGVKTELKNINSFRALHRAVAFEIERQIEVLEAGGTVVQETRGWSEPEQRTFSQRGKEGAEDYRYFPEPDLPPLVIDPAWVEGLRGSLPELPNVRRARLQDQYALPEFDAQQLVQEGATADLFEAAVAAGAPAKATANWIIGEDPKVDAGRLAELVTLVDAGTINRDQGIEVLREAERTGEAPKAIVARRGLAQESDAGALGAVVEALIAEDGQAVRDFRAGNQRAFGALMAEVKKRTGGRANMKLASGLLRERLGS